jgi:thiamine-monophosphate kinase
MTTLLRDIGEDGLLERLRPRLAGSPGDVLLGFGDDVAVTAPSRGRTAWTADAMIEGTHFRFRPGLSDGEWARRLGRMLAVSNLSDLASKGAAPRHALLSWGFPGDAPVERILAVFNGLVDELHASGAVLLGGDTVASPQWVLNLAITGEIPANELLPTRSAARPGWNLFVTGTPGLALCAFEAAEGGAAPADPRLAHFLNQTARLDEGRLLAAAFPGLAMMDISDGLVRDAGRMAAASGVALRLHEQCLPIHADVSRHAQLTGQDPRQLVLRGGEDYELLFAAHATEAEIRQVFERAGLTTPVACIGEVMEGRGATILTLQGETLPATPAGFEHFT